jgi:hypothetical protein
MLNRLLSCIFVVLISTNASAAELAKPDGAVILSVSGNIANTNAPGIAQFDHALLASIGQTEFITDTHWTEGDHSFSGVSVAALAHLVGAKGVNVHAVALNDYAIEIPLQELIDHGALLATSMDGKPLRIRDYGPIWIVFPIKQRPEIRTDRNRDFWIWQLTSLDIK